MQELSLLFVKVYIIIPLRNNRIMIGICMVILENNKQEYFYNNSIKRGVDFDKSDYLYHKN